LRKGYFVPNRHIQLRWNNTCVFWKKYTVLEAESSRTLVPCKNWVSFWKEYFLQIRIFKVEKGSFCSKFTFSTNLKKYWYLSKENHLSQKLQHLANYFHVRMELIFQLIHLILNWVSFWKEYFLQLEFFKVEINSLCSKQTYSAKVKKHMYISKEIHWVKTGASRTLFLCKIELVFERNTSCLS
jgi:hypothetical protein